MKRIIVIFLLLVTQTFAKVYVISDIDDTIKMSNSMGFAGQVYHFFSMKSYPVMSAFYQDIKNYYQDDVTFYYVSAAPDPVYDQDEWLKNHQFPTGATYLRQSLMERTADYKKRVLTQLLENIDNKATVYFFGDNSSHDHVVYLEMARDFNLVNSEIYIRDVSTKETFFVENFVEKKIRGVQYFFSEVELITKFRESSLDTYVLLDELVDNEMLIPSYTQGTLRRRMLKEGRCRLPCSQAKELFSQYYQQHQ